MIEHRLSHKSDIPRLKEIWALCFGDAQDYIDFYFKNAYSPGQTLVRLEDGKIIAMAAVLPLNVLTPNLTGYSAAMLYAIATHPKWQQKGHSTALLAYAKAYLKEQKVKLVTLVPANKALIGFYEKNGFQHGFYIREVRLNSQGIHKLQKECAKRPDITAVSAQEYNALRNRFLHGRLYASYNALEIAYQKKLSCRSGADIFAIRAKDTHEKAGCAIAEKFADNTVMIKELLVDDAMLESSVVAIAERMTAKNYILRLPPDKGSALGSEVRTFGMLQPLSDEGFLRRYSNGYLGIAFD